MNGTNLKNIEVKENEIVFNNFGGEFDGKGQVTFGIFADGMTMVKGDDVCGKPHNILAEYEANRITDVKLIEKIKSMGFPNEINFVKVGPIFFQSK